MSYAKMMKWNKQHRKGTKQPVIMYTSDKPEFTPSISFLDRYFKYQAKSQEEGKEPMTCEEYYKSKMR
jgi:hypothetical protein